MIDPIDHVKGLLEGVEGLGRGRVHLYAYDSAQAAQAPVAVLNYTGLDAASAIGNRFRLEMEVQVVLLFKERANASKLFLEAIRRVGEDNRVVEIGGGLTGPTGGDVVLSQTIKAAVTGTFTCRVRT